MRIRNVLTLLAAVVLLPVSAAFAELPRCVEGEAIVMLRQTAAQSNAASAKSASPNAAEALAGELGAEVVQNFRPITVSAPGGGKPGVSSAKTAKDGETYALARVRSTANESTDAFIERLRANPNVVSVMPNYIVRVSAASERCPNDERYGEQWGLARINMPSVWTHGTGSESNDVVVAVIDTGIIYDHPDLADNMYTFNDAALLERIAANMSADEEFSPEAFFGSHGAWFHTYVEDDEDEGGENLYQFIAVPVGPGDTDGAAAEDIYSEDTDEMRAVGDVSGHGTHVAGIIGAVGNNGTGVSGVNWKVKLLAVNVFSVYEDEGSLSDGSLISDQMRAVDFIIAAKEAGVNIRVANMSLGSWNDPLSDIMSPYEAALKKLSDAGILLCIAAGNEGVDLDAPGYSGIEREDYTGMINTPAMFRFDNSITVGASDSDGSMSYFSNYSPSGRYVDIFAPGSNILSTCRYSPLFAGAQGPNDSSGYRLDSGTSMATPFVSGVAALLCSIFPDRSAGEIKQMILDGADGSVLKDGYSAYGLLDAYGAWKSGMMIETDVKPTVPGEKVQEGAVELAAEFVAGRDELPQAFAGVEIVEEDGGFYLASDTVERAVESLGGERNVFGVSLFPVFSAESEELAGGLGAVAFSVPGDVFGGGNGISDIAVCKVKPDGSALGYTRCAGGEAADGSYDIFEADGSAFSGTFSAEKEYLLVLYIKDGGEYDLDGDAGKITDPAAIVRYERESAGDTTRHGGGGGCSSGAGAAALLLAPLAWGCARTLSKRARRTGE